MKSQTSKGFSVIELIVALSIFIMLTAVLLANYNSINKRLSLDTLAHLIAQWVRETQVSAMSVKSHAGSFKQGFGLHFDQTTPGQFIYFADLPNPSIGNKEFDAAILPCGDSTIECVKEVALQQGNSISKICGSNASPTNPGSCVGGDELASVDIVFTRPSPDAEIMGDVLGTLTPYGNVVIYVKAVTGYERSVSIWTTGQVTVQ